MLMGNCQHPKYLIILNIHDSVRKPTKRAQPHTVHIGSKLQRVLSYFYQCCFKFAKKFAIQPFAPGSVIFQDLGQFDFCIFVENCRLQGWLIRNSAST